MRLGSVCSGCGCIDLGLERAGFEPAWQVEINPKRRSVLARHWPTVRRYHDLREVAQNAADLDPVDLLAGGTPCQDWSIAGNRAGLDGERANLFVEYIRLADLRDIPWLLWENVPGVLSQHDGRDFAICLEGFTGARPEVPAGGWQSAGVAWGPLRWCAWRILDAKAFGVAQRRRRVFVVAGPRDRCRPEVLLEPESVPGDAVPRRASRGIAIRRGAGGLRGDRISATVVRNYARSAAQAGRECLPRNLVIELGGARRYTPEEMERLQGLPDNHTAEGSDGKPLADTPRYQMIGDGAAVPVLEWIGHRLFAAMKDERIERRRTA